MPGKATYISYIFIAMDNYLDITIDVYKNAALKPDVGLCCTTSPMNAFPGLKIPEIMKEMNYGCGSIVSAGDLVNDPKILYVGVGGGMDYCSSPILTEVRVA
jgi:hypothetical protein